MRVLAKFDTFDSSDASSTACQLIKDEAPPGSMDFFVVETEPEVEVVVTETGGSPPAKPPMGAILGAAGGFIGILLLCGCGFALKGLYDKAHVPAGAAAGRARAAGSRWSTGCRRRAARARSPEAVRAE